MTSPIKYCAHDYKVAKARLLRRKTDVHYFSGHLEDIYSRYNAYREIVEQKENVIFVDSQSTDWRQIPAIETIASRIRAFITIPGEVNEK